MLDAGIRFDSNLHLEVKLDPYEGQCDIIVTMNIDGTEVIQTGSVVWDD